MIFRSFGSCIPGLVLALWVSAAVAERAPSNAEERDVVPNRLIIGLKTQVPPESAAALARGGRVGRIGRLNVEVVDYPQGVPENEATRLAKNPAVAFVERDRIRHSTLAEPNDAKFAGQWALKTVHALDAWGMLPGRYLDNSARGQRIKVAVLDSGADCTHPDFRNAGGTSSDAAAGGQFAYDLSKAFVGTTLASPACAWQDDYGHGTHVAGTIAAATNNGEGVAGLAYPVELVVLKVLGKDGKGPDSKIAAAIMAAADAGAVVISMSLGETGYSQTLQNAINYAWQRNSLVVAAAGNDNNGELFFPAAANHVVGVAAVDSAGQKAKFSNFGEQVDISAPGVNILSTVPTYPVTQGVQNYAYYSGTSMAAPHVSAVAGMVAMTTPGVASDAIALRLQQSAEPVPSAATWTPEYGYGVLNAASALKYSARTDRTGGLTGQIVNAQGYPVAGVQVYLNGAGATTDYTGLFRIANQAPGTYTLQVTANGGTQAITVVVPAGGDAPLTFVANASTAMISGTITAEDGPVANAVVQALAGGLVQASAVTNEAGQYWLAVPAGSYQVRASAVGFTGATSAAQGASAGASAHVSLKLSRMGWISGVVKDGAGQPVAQAQVTISGDAASSGAVTDSTGAFSSLGVPPGAYSISAAAGAGSAQLSGVLVASDSNSRVALQIGGASTEAGPDVHTPFAPIRVNAGGPSYTDPQGIVWQRDTGYAGGGTFSSQGAVSGTAAPGLYQSERYGWFQYRFAVPEGSYAVTLKFAEVFFDKPGQRVFDIVINGQKVLGRFDVVAAAGGRNKAVDRTFTVQAVGGQIAIEGDPVVENPKISAIEILQAPGASSSGSTKLAGIGRY